MASGREDMPAALPSVLWSPPFPESSTSFLHAPQDALSAPELHTRHLSRSHSALGAAGDAARTSQLRNLGRT